MRWCHDGFFIFQTWIIWTLSQVTSDRKRTPLSSRGREGEDGRSLGLDEQKWKWNQCLECLKGSLNTRSCWQREPRGRSCRLSEAGENFNTAFSKKQNWVTWGAGGLGGESLPLGHFDYCCFPDLSAAVTFRLIHCQKNVIYDSSVSAVKRLFL